MNASNQASSAPQTRTVTLNIRVKPTQRDVIDQAAAVQGKSRSEFMIESSYQRAQRIRRT